MSISVCILDDFLLDILLQQFDIGNPWILASTIALVLKANRLTKRSQTDKEASVG